MNLPAFLFQEKHAPLEFLCMIHDSQQIPENDTP